MYEKVIINNFFAHKNKDINAVIFVRKSNDPQLVCAKNIRFNYRSCAGYLKIVPLAWLKIYLFVLD